MVGLYKPQMVKKVAYSATKSFMMMLLVVVVAGACVGVEAGVTCTVVLWRFAKSRSTTRIPLCLQVSVYVNV